MAILHSLGLRGFLRGLFGVVWGLGFKGSIWGCIGCRVEGNYMGFGLWGLRGLFVVIQGFGFRV